VEIDRIRLGRTFLRDLPCHYSCPDPGRRANQDYSLKWKPIVLPSTVHLERDDAYREFDEYLRSYPKRGTPSFEIIVTVVGRFDYLPQQMVAVRAHSEDKPSVYMAGFGHLNASLRRLVWQSVSNPEVRALR
jgi:hypothetical protein